jgi:hypothetical protein
VRPVPSTLLVFVVALAAAAGAAGGGPGPGPTDRAPAAGGSGWGAAPPATASLRGPATRATHLATPLAPPTRPLRPSEPAPRRPNFTLRAPASPSTPAAGDSLPPEPREFFFTRGAYTDYGRGFWRRRPSWAIDYPDADHHFTTVLDRLTNLDTYASDNAVRLDDPSLRRYPFVYILEVGNMDLTPEEIRGLRDYLDAGGFLVVDDFWGEREWANFEYQMARVLPGRRIVPLPMEHPLFTTFYEIDEVRQTPAYGRGINGRPTTECSGCQATVLGIFDDAERLMVVINWNTDLGDAWEHADDPFYPLPYSTYAYQVGVNMVVYGMSH